MNIPQRSTLHGIEVAPRPLAAYRGIVSAELLDEVAVLAAALDGARVLQITAAAYGEVAELVAPSVGLLRGFGLDAHWRVVWPDDRALDVAKRISDAMRGTASALDQDDLYAYIELNRRCAAALGNEWDIVVVHDPEPLALIATESAPQAAWIWRCHVDASTPSPAVWDLLRVFVLGYDAFVFTAAEFCPPHLDRERLVVLGSKATERGRFDQVLGEVRDSLAVAARLPSGSRTPVDEPTAATTR